MFLLIGQCLNFTNMLLLVLMLRRCITKLRKLSFINKLVLDRHIDFHKLNGYLTVTYSIIHTVCYIGNFCQNILKNPKKFFTANSLTEKNKSIQLHNYTVYEWFLTSRPGYFGLVAGTAFPTGVFLVAILWVMTVCSMKWVRRGGYFEVSSSIYLSNIKTS